MPVVTLSRLKREAVIFFNWGIAGLSRERKKENTAIVLLALLVLLSFLWRRESEAERAALLVFSWLKHREIHVVVRQARPASLHPMTCYTYIFTYAYTQKCKRSVSFPSPFVFFLLLVCLFRYLCLR
jgi:hypothetical protein